MKNISSALLLVLYIVESLARPVSYPGGWTVMQTNELGSHYLHIHYSPSAKYSIGYRREIMSQSDINFHSIQYNRLVKRWNKPQEQANFYWKSGAGVFTSDQNNSSQVGAFTGFAVDWETRRYFTSYENRYYYLNNQYKEFSQKARLGIAPYIGDYGDIHTWLMLQVDNTPQNPDNFIVTPLIRIFKGPVMIETGYSENDEFLFNFIYRL